MAESGSAPAEVKVQRDQVWADNDPRSVGRTLRVLAVIDTVALCLVLSDRHSAMTSRVGKTTAIGLHRFRPNHSGYRLVSG